MEILWQELSFGFPESHELERVVIRLIAAAFLGACIGIERQRAGKSAGVRTHMLVTVRTTVFLLACLRFGMNLDDLAHFRDLDTQASSQASVSLVRVLS